jgi:hypothetical protein
MDGLNDFLTFKSMVSPVVLQVLFWAGIAGTFYGACLLFSLDHWAWWMALVFGTLLTRVIFEFAVLSFRTDDRLSEIAAALNAGKERVV